MSKIIFLNGCGSAGKTSLAKSIQELSTELWLTFGIDTFIAMLPSSKQEAYLQFIPGENERGPTMDIATAERGKKLFGLMPPFAQMLANEGNNLIIDEVLFTDVALQNYVKHLFLHTVYYVGIFCELSVMQAREISRGDRCIGLANSQIERVHPLNSQRDRSAYDLQVDTSNTPPPQAARQILEFMASNPHPRAFKKFAG